MSVNQRELARRAVRLRAAIDRNITNLNLGGCGAFALLAARALKKLGIAQVEIVLPDQFPARALKKLGIAQVEIVLPGQFDWDDALTPREALNQGMDPDDLDCGHVGVRYILNGVTYCMDSTKLSRGPFSFGRTRYNTSKRVAQRLGRNGTCKIDIEYPFGGGLTVEEFAPVVANPRGWNTSYDRRQTKKLRALVQAYLVLGVQ